MTQKNTNCLAGMKCPDCASLQPFLITATSNFTMYDGGTEGYDDVIHDNTATCVCICCDRTGTVADFKSPTDETA
jgi:hypothetical protein